MFDAIAGWIAIVIEGGGIAIIVIGAAISSGQSPEILYMIDGTRSLADVVRLSGQDRFDVFRVVVDLGVALDDALLASAGGIYKFSDDTRAGMFFDYRESSIGADPTQELSVFLSNRVGVDWRLQAFVFRGFSDSGANWGAGLQVRRYLPSLR